MIKFFIYAGIALLGMQSAKNVKVIQPTDPAKQRVLPKYDFPVNLVNATPGVSWFMKYEVIKEDQVKEIIKIVESDVVVFNRPKAFVGSSGSVWASEYMTMKQSDTVLFSAEKKTTCVETGMWTNLSRVWSKVYE